MGYREPTAAGQAGRRAGCRRSRGRSGRPLAVGLRAWLWFGLGVGLWFGLVLRPALGAAADPSPLLQRFALVVGANDGGPGHDRLRYAGSDARSMAGVLAQLGGVRAQDAVLLLEPSPAALTQALKQLAGRIAEARRPGHRLELVFYYSGHSDEVGLLLGSQRLDYPALRAAIERTAADVTIAILDSCSAGAFTRQKGGVHQLPFLVDTSVRVSGHAFLASSSENEAAQESDRIGSSFFTYFLISGLRGAADVSGDGRVTLNEAYNFAFNETLAGTERTVGGAQHPAYEIQLSGTGDVVMTDLREPSARLQLPRHLQGRIHVRAPDGVLASELTKHGGAEILLALEPGSYRVTVESAGSYFETRVTLITGQTTPLPTSTLVRLAGEPTLPRGGPPRRTPSVLAEEIETEPLWAPVAFTLIPRLSTNRLYGPRVQNAFAFNLLYGRATRLRGLELGVLASLRGEDAVGLQLSGFANGVGGNLLGAQATGGVNVVGRSARGLQLASVINIVGGNAAGIQITSALNLVGGNGWGFQLAGLDLVHGSFHGVQLAGLGAVTGGELTGMQLSTGIASSGLLQGVQIAIINIAGEVTGAQLGFINIARTVHGAQLGLLNIARSVHGAAIGLVSFIKDGTHTLELYGNDLMPLNLGTKLGGQRAYGILGVGIDPFRDTVRWSFGAGLGVHFPLLRGFFLDADFLVHSAQPDIKVYDSSVYHVLSELRLLVGWQALPKLALFIGPTLHVSVTNDPCCEGQVSQFDGGERRWLAGASTIRFGPGLTGGIRAF